MLKTALVLGALVIVFAAAWIALRRSRRPEPPAVFTDFESYIHRPRFDAGSPAEMDESKAPVFPPPQSKEQ